MSEVGSQPTGNSSKTEMEREFNRWVVNVEPWRPSLYDAFVAGWNARDESINARESQKAAQVSASRERGGLPGTSQSETSTPTTDGEGA